MNQKPVARFRAGQISCAIWENEMNVNGTMKMALKASVSRRYKNRDGTWKSSSSFSRNEVFLAIHCLRQAVGKGAFGQVRLQVLAAAFIAGQQGAQARLRFVAAQAALRDTPERVEQTCIGIQRGRGRGPRVGTLVSHGVPPVAWTPVSLRPHDRSVACIQAPERLFAFLPTSGAKTPAARDHGTAAFAQDTPPGGLRDGDLGVSGHEVFSGHPVPVRASPLRPVRRRRRGADGPEQQHVKVGFHIRYSTLLTRSAMSSANDGHTTFFSPPSCLKVSALSVLPVMGFSHSAR